MRARAHHDAPYMDPLLVGAMLRSHWVRSAELAQLANSVFAALELEPPVDPRTLGIELGHSLRPVPFASWRAHLVRRRQTRARIDYRWEDNLSESRFNALIGVSMALLAQEEEDDKTYALAGHLAVPYGAHLATDLYLPQWFTQAVLESRPRNCAYLQVAR